MGLGIPNYGRLDRDMARKREQKNDVAIKNRKQCQPIGIYCLPIIETENTLIRCIFCGHPVFQTYNRVLYISAYPSTPVERAVHDTIHCKRCGQPYSKLV